MRGCSRRDFRRRLLCFSLLRQSRKRLHRAAAPASPHESFAAQIFHGDSFYAGSSRNASRTTKKAALSCLTLLFHKQKSDSGALRLCCLFFRAGKERAGAHGSGSNELYAFGLFLISCRTDGRRNRERNERTLRFYPRIRYVSLRTTCRGFLPAACQAHRG